eukprot:4385020-Amphidinium_carterae.1
MDMPRAWRDCWVQTPPEADAAAKYAARAPSLACAICTGYHQYGGRACQRSAAACVSDQALTSARSSLAASPDVCRRRSRWNPRAVYMCVGEVSFHPTLMQDMIMAPQGPETVAHG